VRLYLDTETYSETPIGHGTYRYIADCEVMIITFAVDDGPVQCIDLTAEYSSLDELREHILAADEIVAHNAVFDRNVMAKLIPGIPFEKWRCSMVKALAHSLPGSLDKLGDIYHLGIDIAKHKEGKALVHLFCKPQPKKRKLRRATAKTHPAEWQRFIAYACNDIEAMRVIYQKLPDWNTGAEELALWQLDQRINDRGFAVDVVLATAAIEATKIAQAKLAQETATLTAGAVKKATQRDAMLLHILESYGHQLKDLTKSTVEIALEDQDLPPGMRELLIVRQQASLTSTSKFNALIRGVSDDSRLRGTLQYNGANRTGRWAGRTFQPHNLMRPTLDHDEIDDGIEAILCGAADLIYGNTMEVISNVTRGCIIAPPGKKLVVADLSNIEGRVLAWLADEEWKLQAFRDFDAGIGPDLYMLAYAKSFNVDHQSVTKPQRQVGKVEELAMGYEGGVGAFLTFALAYSLDLDQLAEDAWPTLPKDIVSEADSFYDWMVEQKRPTFGLPRKTFVTCDSLKRMWRRAHPNITSLWPELKTAAVEAVNYRGKAIPVRHIKVMRSGMWVRILLPSGRSLCYPSPQCKDGQLSYMGTNQYTRKWSRTKTYGGKLAENVTQAVAKDILAVNMPRIDKLGYKIVLTVHDEIIAETPNDPDFNVKHLAALMSEVPPWAEGLPLAAAGFECRRYRKG
jgi:DNA polymerase